MQFDLKIHEGIFEVTTSGDATLQGYYDFAKAILEHEEWKPGGLILLDNTALDTGPLTINDVEAIVDITEQYSEIIGKAKMAVVVGRTLDYGMSRMWENLLELRDAWSASEQVFRNREDTIAWLKNE